MTGSVSMSAAHRFRYTLAAGATAVVIGAGFTVVGFERQGDSTTAERTSTDLPLTKQPPIDLGTEADPLLDASAAPSLPPLASPSASAPASPSPSPSRTSASPAPSKTSPSPKKTPAKRKTTAPAQVDSGSGSGSAPKTSGSVLQQALAHINAAREDEGLDPYTLDDNLSRAAAVHNDRMIDGCGLSHQCSGEEGIGPRFSAQGVQWRSAGENIGQGNADDNAASIARAANGLTDMMLAEVPPEDGHRKNLLSKGFKRIGLSIVRDGSGKVWMTQDFVG